MDYYVKSLQSYRFASCCFLYRFGVVQQAIILIIECYKKVYCGWCYVFLPAVGVLVSLTIPVVLADLRRLRCCYVLLSFFTLLGDD